MDPFLAPKIDNVKEFFSDIFIAPVEVSLGDIKEMEIVFTRVTKRRPGTATKFWEPVRGFLLDEEKVLIVGIPR